MAQNYDPSSVLITFTTPFPMSVLFTGLLGAFVTGKRDENAWKKKVGAQGDVARAKVRNKGGTIEITVMQTSPTNSQLGILHAASESLPVTGLDAGALLITDLLSQTLVHVKTAWILKVADVEYGEEIMGRKWTFDCESLDINYGAGGINT
jgi:hypothetical protein